MKCSLGISNFLDEISSLSHSTAFLYFFALIAEEGFLISPCYSLEVCIQMGISFLFFFPSCLSYISVAFKCVRTLGSFWIHSAILSNFFLKMYPKWTAKLLSMVALVCRNISTIIDGDLSFWLTLILSILLRCFWVAMNLEINLGRTEISECLYFCILHLFNLLKKYHILILC